MNLKAISKNVGLALLVSSFFMMLSLVVSIINGKDSGFVPLAVSFLITFLTGVFPYIFVRKTQPITLRDGFVIIILAWLLSFIFGMLPYVMWGGEMSMADAWFESVSGFTTTGATILKDIEALPKSLLFWRSSTHFIGGLGVVVFLLLIVPSASPFRRQMTKIEVSSLSKEGYNLQSRKMVKVIASVYVGIFFLATLSLFICGMPLFDAINHGFSVCATGGFSIKNASVAAYGSTAINIVLVVFMIVATINFALIFTCLSRRSLKPLLKNDVSRFYLCSILILTALSVLSLRFQGDNMSWSEALNEGFYTTVSYITTTGFTFTKGTQWTFLAGIILMYASLQCGCAGSTSSGIKVDRMIVAYKSIKRQITACLHPGSAGRIKFSGSYMPDEQVMPVILYIVLYVLILVFSVGALLAVGVGGTEAMSGSIACLGNVGPGLGEINVMGTYDSMPAAAKMIFTLDMFLGRIEIYPLLIVVSIIFRKDK